MLYIFADSLCSLKLYPREVVVGITVDCGGTCSFTTSAQTHWCQDLINQLRVQQCNQADCNPTVYNLSACITAENGINTTYTTNQNANCQCNRDRDAATNSIATTYIPTNVYRTGTINRTEAQNVLCTTKPLFNTEAQVVIGSLVGLVMVLLVMAIIPWTWICWKSKVNRELKRDKQQARYESTLI